MVSTIEISHCMYSNALHLCAGMGPDKHSTQAQTFPSLWAFFASAIDSFTLAAMHKYLKNLWIGLGQKGGGASGKQWETSAGTHDTIVVVCVCVCVCVWCVCVVCVWCVCVVCGVCVCGVCVCVVCVWCHYLLLGYLHSQSSFLSHPCSLTCAITASCFNLSYSPI